VPTLRASGIEVKAVRLDSGDLAELSVQVRHVLDDAGCPQVRIFCSGNLDEYELARLLGNGAPIDGFGIGTRLVVSDDAPFLDCAYKLQAYAGQPRRKRSAGKATWPGAKQVFRLVDQDGRAIGDTVALADEDIPGSPLLVPAMRGGVRLLPRQPLAAMREQTLERLGRLPAHLKQLDPTSEPYPVHFTSQLQALATELDKQVH
jgi:nicotinate phosphoribosyltransferase